MKITDKQRIDFVQRHGMSVDKYSHAWLAQRGFVNERGYKQRAYAFGRSWRQAVDKAIKAYMGGKK